jgi:hypothetical protein
LLSIALRVLTLIEFVGRRHLVLEKDKIAGFYAKKPLLEAFADVTLTVIELPHQIICHVTPLSPVQLRVLEFLGFSRNSIRAWRPFLSNRLKNGRTVSKP